MLFQPQIYEANPAYLSIALNYVGLVAYAASDDIFHIVCKSETHPSLHRHLFHHTRPKHRVKLINGHFPAVQILYERLHLTPLVSAPCARCLNAFKLVNC